MLSSRSKSQLLPGTSVALRAYPCKVYNTQTDVDALVAALQILLPQVSA